jgi:hypothetical protein
VQTAANLLGPQQAAVAREGSLNALSFENYRKELFAMAPIS